MSSDSEEEDHHSQQFDSNLTATFGLICQCAHEMIGVDHSGFVRFDVGNETGEVIADYPPLPGLVGQKIRLRGVPAEDRLLADDKPVAINDVDGAQDLGDVQELLQSYDIKSICIVKVRFNSVVIGSLSLDFRGKQRDFTEEQITRCVSFAAFASELIAARQLAIWLESFQSATVAVTSERQVDSLLRTIVEQAQRLFMTEKVGLYQRCQDEKERDTLLLVACSEPKLQGRRMTKLDGGMAWQLILGNEPYLETTDYREYKHKAQGLEGVGSLLQVPLLRQGERIGAIYLSDVTGRQFTRFDARLLRHFADMATIALQQTALVDRMRMLSVASADISTNFDSKTLGVRLASIAAHTARILRAEMCGVFLLDPEKRLMLSASHGHREDAPLPANPFEIRDEPRGGLTGAIFARLLKMHGERRKAAPTDDSPLAFNVWANELTDDPAVKSADFDASASGHCFSLLAMPLIRREQNRETVVGMLRISNKKGVDGKPADAIHFNAEDIWILRIFTEAVVVAIQGARVFETLQRQKDLANTLAGSAPLDDRLTSAAKSVVTLVDRSFCRLLLAHDSANHLQLHAAELHPDISKIVQWTPAGPESSPISDWPHLQSALDSGVPFELHATNPEHRRVLERLSEHFAIRENGAPLHIGVMFGVPLTVSQRPIGLMSVGQFYSEGQPPPAPFTDEQRNFIASIAAQVTVMIDRERRPHEIAESAKRREETLKYLALYFIKAGVGAYNHHGTAIELYRAAMFLEDDAEKFELDGRIKEEIHWILQGARALCELLVSPFSIDMPRRDLNELILDWVASVRELKAFSKITFDLHLDRTKGVQVQVDIDLLRAALFVFLKNAAAAMQESIVRSVSIVTAGGGEEKTRISFTDSGPGIPPDKLERIRADLRAGATEQKERGLGLLTAQLIVTRLGGEMLEPQSSARGATFTIVLPRVLGLT